MSGQAEGMERRASQRYGCAGDAELAVPGRGLRYQGKIGDLSLAGCFLEVTCALERGTSVEIWMNARGQPLRVAANLVVRRNGGAGFRFHSVTPRKLEQIRGLIAELAEEKAQREGAAGSEPIADVEAVAKSCDTQKRAADVPGRVRKCLACLRQRWRRWLRRRTAPG